MAQETNRKSLLNDHASNNDNIRPGPLSGHSRHPRQTALPRLHSLRTGSRTRFEDRRAPLRLARMAIDGVGDLHRRRRQPPRRRHGGPEAPRRRIAQTRPARLRVARDRLHLTCPHKTSISLPSHGRYRDARSIIRSGDLTGFHFGFEELENINSPLIVKATFWII